ncbi:hypothetical protein V6N13_035129 [Hibiscus sabdariffa]
MVNIWNEPWLPGPGDDRVRNCHIDISYIYISDLIDSATATWKVDVLESLFDEARVSRICSIPLSKAGLSDEIVWRPDGSGVYTVKSGYRLIRGDLSSSTSPVEDVIKCNFDSAYDALSRESMSGFICRDNVGLIMASGVTFHRHVVDTFVAKALACLQATIFAKDLGFAKVVIGGDSLTVIRKVCSSTPDGSLIGPIIHDIREASKEIESVIFSFW